MSARRIRNSRKCESASTGKSVMFEIMWGKLCLFGR